MLRVVRGETGQIYPDTGRHRAPGRGAYVCRDVQCLEKVRRRRGLRRALRGEVADVAYDVIRRCIEPDATATP